MFLHKDLKSQFLNACRLEVCHPKQCQVLSVSLLQYAENSNMNSVAAAQVNIICDRLEIFYLKNRSTVKRR